MKTNSNEITQDRISQLASNITIRLRESIGSIQSVNDDIHVLSINAKILAAKAGASGKGFAVVADSVRGMVDRTQRITDALQTSVESTVGELTEINSFLGTKVRAERLSQVAENMIDIVDRNLYERSCDVRWWATESAVTTALERPCEENAAQCARRLGVILDSYTVYLDIVVCDLGGTIIANGRPERFKSEGLSVSRSTWFNEAVNTAGGDEYGFEGVHRSALARGAPALVYSCGVRENGDVHGKLIGVLGVVFNWDGLGQVVVKRAKDMLLAETDRPLRAFLVSESGAKIASTDDNQYEANVPDALLDTLKDSTRGIILPDAKKNISFIAGWAASIGFETYRTGWYAMIQEDSGRIEGSGRIAQ